MYTHYKLMSLIKTVGYRSLTRFQMIPLLLLLRPKGDETGGRMASKTRPRRCSSSLESAKAEPRT